MKQRGVLCYANGSRIRIAPPLVIEEDLLWSGVDILEKSLNDLVNIDGDID
jgi:ornithine--oxo-acid transaminase